MLSGDGVVNKEADGVNLLISILLRYPEVVSTKYLPETQALSFTFIMMHENRTDLNSITSALEAYHQFKKQTMNICEIDGKYEEPYLVVTVTRDIKSLTQSELGLIVELIKHKFAHSLVFEPGELPEDEMEFQEEVINHMLADIRSREVNKKVMAVREEGKLLVFSR